MKSTTTTSYILLAFQIIENAEVHYWRCRESNFPLCQCLLSEQSVQDPDISSPIMSTMDSSEYIAKSASEVIEIVDEHNNVLEPKTRAEMREKHLIHRATYAFIRTSGNYFYVQVIHFSLTASYLTHCDDKWLGSSPLSLSVLFFCFQKRSLLKDYCPGNKLM